MAESDPTIERLKEGSWREVASINNAFHGGLIDEAGWHEAMAALVKDAYLAADNPYGQAGHSGNASTWEASRAFIAEALHVSGTFLDVGCASGILMESVQRWGLAKNLTIEPYGLEIIPELAQLAKRRLPAWADRIHVGNIRTWGPPKNRFDFVLIRPEYAPPSRRAEMIRHVQRNVLHPKGRLIVFVGSEERESRKVESDMSSHGLNATGRAEIPHSKDARLVRRLFWIDSVS